MQRHEYAAFKRCLEYYIADPDFRAKMDRDPTQAVSLLNYKALLAPQAAAAALKAILFGTLPPDGFRNPYLQAYAGHYGAVEAYVSRTLTEDRFYSRELYRFGELVRSRCRMENAEIERHSAIRYFPLAFELTEGCRVQCSFCGFSAPPFRGCFPWNEENARLWEAVLRAAKGFIGPAAGTAPCYFATEPLDHPDYEKFLGTMEQVFGTVPQTTTAAADREPERFRSLLSRIGSERLQAQASVRVSVRSLRQFQKIMETFSEDELAYVELLCNNKESINRVSDSGRSRKNDGIAAEKRFSYSICCIAGFLVSMPRKELRLIEPELPDEEFPLGYRVRAVRSFADGEEFLRALEELTAEYARSSLPEDLALAWNKNIQIEPEEEGKLRFYGGGRISHVRDGQLMRGLIQCVKEGCTFSRAAEKLELSGTARAAAYRCLQELYLRGYLRLL